MPGQGEWSHRAGSIQRINPDNQWRHAISRAFARSSTGAAGASPMSSSRLLEGLERIVFSQLYGQTEYFPISVLRKADHDRQRPDLSSSCGVPVASCDVKVLDESDQEVAPGQPGEICVRAAHAVSQYWKRSQDTEALFRNGWLHTRDIARADEKGYLYI